MILNLHDNNKEVELRKTNIKINEKSLWMFGDDEKKEKWEKGTKNPRSGLPLLPKKFLKCWKWLKRESGES